MQDLTERVLHRDAKKQLVMRGCFGTENKLFRSVLAVRQLSEGPLSIYRFDETSMHYVTFHQGRPIGSLTTPRCRDGQIDCQAFYPPLLVKQFHSQIASACKFRIRPNPNSGMFLLRLMIREAWRDQLAEGIRLDLINVARNLVPFYRRIGYIMLQGWDFVHPSLGTDSVPLILPADPTRPSFCQDLFASIADPLPMKDIQAVLDSQRRHANQPR